MTQENITTTEDTRTSSVSIKTNAKGDLQYDIKLYFDASAESNDDVVARLNDLKQKVESQVGGKE